MSIDPIVTPITGFVGLGIAFIIYLGIAKRSGGEGKVAKIAEQIHQGAMVFMRREFFLISIFAVLIGAAIFFFQKPEYGKQQSLAFFLGALSSSLAGFIGMFTATNRKIEELITDIEKNSSREYIIILQSDEGPRVTDLGFQDKLSRDEVLQIHGRILNALYFLGIDKERIRSLRTPVNTFRFIFNNYFGLTLDLLPNHAYEHPNREVFNFSDISPILDEAIP